MPPPKCVSSGREENLYAHAPVDGLRAVVLLHHLQGDAGLPPGLQVPADPCQQLFYLPLAGSTALAVGHGTLIGISGYLLCYYWWPWREHLAVVHPSLP